MVKLGELVKRCPRCSLPVAESDWNKHKTMWCPEIKHRS
jgi:hypothetical protein